MSSDSVFVLTLFESGKVDKLNCKFPITLMTLTSSLGIVGTGVGNELCGEGKK
jgi:hypothetical protein